MNEFSEPEVTRSEFISILSQELLKENNEGIYGQLPHIDIEQLYQYYLNQNMAAEEFAVRFVKHLNKTLTTATGIAFAGLSAKKPRTSNPENLPPRFPYLTYARSICKSNNETETVALS